MLRRRRWSTSRRRGSGSGARARCRPVQRAWPPPSPTPNRANHGAAGGLVLHPAPSPTQQPAPPLVPPTHEETPLEKARRLREEAYVNVQKGYYKDAADELNEAAEIDLPATPTRRWPRRATTSPSATRRGCRARRWAPISGKARFRTSRGRSSADGALNPRRCTQPCRLPPGQRRRRSRQAPAHRRSSRKPCTTAVLTDSTCALDVRRTARALARGKVLGAQTLQALRARRGVWDTRLWAVGEASRRSRCRCCCCRRRWPG